MRKHIALVAGLAFYWPYFRNSYFGYFFSSDKGLSLPALEIFLVMMICGIVAWWRSSLVESMFYKTSRWVLAAGTATTLLLYADVLLPSIAIVDFMAALFVGVMSSILPMAWLYYCVGEEKALRATVAGDTALSLFISFVVTSFNAPFPLWASALYPLFPLISALCWAWGTGGKGTKARTSFGTLKSTGTMIAVGLFVFGVSVVAGTYTTGVSDFSDNHTNVRLVLSLASTLLLAIALRMGSSHPSTVVIVWGIAFVYVFAGILAAMLFGPLWTNVAADIIIVGRLTIWTLFWLLLADMSLSERISPATLGGVFVLLRGASSLATDFSSLLDFPVMAESAYKVVFLLILLILLGCSLAFMVQNGKRNSRGDASKSIVAMLGQGEAFDRASVCACLAEDFRLTDRESAVLMLLSQGHTVKKIAETLFLSESTIRSHTKNLYRKLGCHTKQEVIDLVNRGGKTAE